MTENEFERAYAKVRIHEGGYSNHKSDPGGATNRGVTQRVYDLFRKDAGMATRSVKLITDDETALIYKQRYWDVVKGSSLPAGVGYVVFDGAVNSGPTQSVKWLQRALGSAYTGKIDGLIGPSTLAAVHAHVDHDLLIDAILDRRMAFLRALETWDTFGKGWTRRVDDVLAVGQAWAMGSVGPEITFVPDGNAKAEIKDAKPAPANGVADAATGGGIGIGGLAAMVQAAKEQLAPLAGATPWVNDAIAYLTVAGIALAFVGVGYRAWASRKRATLVDALDLVPA